jgi:hypothetical protein
MNLTCLGFLTRTAILIDTPAVTSVRSSLLDFTTKFNFRPASPFEKGGLRGILNSGLCNSLSNPPGPFYKRGKLSKVGQAPSAELLYFIAIESDNGRQVCKVVLVR